MDLMYFARAPLVYVPKEASCHFIIVKLIGVRSVVTRYYYCGPHAAITHVTKSATVWCASLFMLSTPPLPPSHVHLS